ncbi:DUF4407 domain-containing protein [Dactylosporangium siamense]|uniref:CHAT domain-containing protein n=1 Tax=Dactylosporangium siamense TaxID=685454 RepID=A0A919PI91_9ACTN|nr:DUF4407 domain-containing protein [Dactylosporangium siamense]GIG45345.1 hypothetical protein Dsi01nite_033860 [Dactylosporangium siamense]
MRSLADLLARLGGADLGALVPAERANGTGVAKVRNRFATLGGLLLVTGGVAVVSMIVALLDGFGLALVVAVPAGVALGAAMVIVERALLLDRFSIGAVRSQSALLLPRLAIAGLIGLAVAVPLTLRIFHSQIEHQMSIDNLRRAEDGAAALAHGDRQRQLDAVQADISKYEDHLAGNIFVSAPDLDTAESEYRAALADYQSKQQAAEQAWAAWRCELDGQLCGSSSGKMGNGPRAQALKREYDRKEADARAAQALLRAKQTALDSARKDASRLSADQLAQAQDEAARVLPGLRQQRDQLKVALQADLDEINEKSAANTGLPAQTVALLHLADDGGSASLPYLLTITVLMMTGLLPVSVKALVIVGSPTAYDAAVPSEWQLPDRTTDDDRRLWGRPWADDDPIVVTDPALPPTGSDSDQPERWLSASAPARAAVDAEIDLLVRVVTARPTSGDTTSAPLKAFAVPARGVRLTLIVEAPSGLRQLGPLRQALLVPAATDSEPVLFTFRTTSPGLHDVTVTAWLGGTFVGEVHVQVAVGVGAASTPGSHSLGEMAALVGRAGEATLQVLLQGDQYLFQLMVDDELFDTVPGATLAANPMVALEHARQTLRTMSKGSSGYTARNAAKRLQSMGIGLWDGMVPRELREQFWSIRDQISMFTIASARDTLPWELVYPVAPGQDAGFLVEQFPVLRRLHNQRRAKSVSLQEASFVVPAESPRLAAAEVAAIRAMLGRPAVEQDVVTDLDRLIALVEDGDVGVLHFACHNTFDPVGGGCIDMNGEAFVPEMLYPAAVSSSLRRRSPLVFLNACTSGVDVQRFTDVSGFATQFIRAGAGVFVGTLWDVRSESASQFATGFYRNLHDGMPLGTAVQHCRTALRGDGSDPTWLAYTVYGDPACVRRHANPEGAP